MRYTLFSFSLLLMFFIYGCEEAALEQEKELQEKVEQVESEQKVDVFEELIFNEHSPKMYEEFTEDLLKYAKSMPKNYIALNFVGNLKYQKPKYSDDTIVSYTGFSSTGTSDINIYLNRLNEEVSQSKVFEIIEFYLSTPGLMDQMNFQESYILEHEEKSNYKIIQYAPNEDIEGFLKRSIYIFLEENNDEIATLRISNDQPRWIIHYEKNGYERKDWDLDL